jgi:hypothetical protein
MDLCRLLTEAWIDATRITTADEGEEGRCHHPGGIVVWETTSHLTMKVEATACFGTMLGSSEADGYTPTTSALPTPHFHDHLHTYTTLYPKPNPHK